MDVTEVIGAVAGFLYVILEIRQKKAMWIVGGISALFYILLFFNASLSAVLLSVGKFLWLVCLEQAEQG